MDQQTTGGVKRAADAELDRRIEEMRWRLRVLDKGPQREEARRGLRALEAEKRERSRARRPTLQDGLRTFLVFWGAQAGLALAILVAVLLGGAATLATIDVGPTRTVYGRVEGFRWTFLEEGRYVRVLVRVDDRLVLTERSRFTPCRVGERVQLVEHPLLGGRARYTIALGECGPA